MLHTWAQELSEENIYSGAYTHQYWKEKWWNEHIILIKALSGWLIPAAFEFLYAKCKWRVTTQELAMVK